jgi:hypothetical protein
MRIGELGPGHVHDRVGVAAEGAVTHVAHHADDLARPFLHAGAQATADRDAFADRAGVGPILPRHRLVDDGDAGCARRVLLREGAPAHERDLEHVEVVGRHGREAAAAVRGSVERPPLDDEAEAEPALQRHAAAGRGRLDFGQ